MHLLLIKIFRNINPIIIIEYGIYFILLIYINKKYKYLIDIINFE